MSFFIGNNTNVPQMMGRSGRMGDATEKQVRNYSVLVMEKKDVQVFFFALLFYPFSHFMLLTVNKQFLQLADFIQTFQP